MFYKNRFIILSIVLICGMYGIVAVYHDPSVQVQKSFMSKKARLEGKGKAAIGGPFQMVSHVNKSFSDKDLLGKYSLLFFGFTYCPDVCPTTLSKLTQVYESLPEALQRELQVVMVSVDPARDTPAVLADYVPAFHPDFIGLTGTQEQVDGIVKAYKVYAAKSPMEGGDYTMNHSGFLYLMDPNGVYLTHFSHEDTPDILAEKLTDILYK